MNFSLKQLVDDHINLSYILILTERHLKHRQTVEQLTDALPFLCSCMDYLCDYPQQIHHPLEDQLIDFMMSQNSDAKRLVPAIQKEHETLEQMTEQIRQQLHIARDQNDMEVLLLLKKPLLDCLNKQLQHINNEETLLLPFIESLMTPKNWQIFNLQLEQQPAFNEINKKQTLFASTLYELVSLGRNGRLTSEHWRSF